MDDRVEELRKNLMTAFDLVEADILGEVFSVNPLRQYDRGSLAGLPIALSYAFRLEDKQEAVEFLHHHLWPLHDRKIRLLMAKLDPQKRHALLPALLYAFETIADLKTDPAWPSKRETLEKSLS